MVMTHLDWRIFGSRTLAMRLDPVEWPKLFDPAFSLENDHAVFIIEETTRIAVMTKGTERTAGAASWLKRMALNGKKPEVIARQLLRQEPTPFFRYFRIRQFATEPTALDSIPDGELPLYHAAKIHRAAADTGRSAQVDSIRAVRVSYRVTNGRPGSDERFADVSRVISSKACATRPA